MFSRAQGGSYRKCWRFGEQLQTEHQNQEPLVRLQNEQSLKSKDFDVGRKLSDLPAETSHRKFGRERAAPGNR